MFAISLVKQGLITSRNVPFSQDVPYDILESQKQRGYDSWRDPDFDEPQVKNEGREWGQELVSRVPESLDLERVKMVPGERLNLPMLAGWTSNT